MKRITWTPRLLAGMGGCLLLAASDWLMIWGDTAFSGALPWLTAGAAAIPPERNALALALALPAVLLYAAGLLGLDRGLEEERSRRTWRTLTAAGMTPWLAIHLLYLLILFLFGWLTRQGLEPYGPCEALFHQFAFLIPLGEAVMVLPFLWWLWATARGRTVWPRWMAGNSPLLWYLVLKALTLALPDTPFRLAFTNGLMSEAMLLWFALLLAVPPRR